MGPTLVPEGFGMEKRLRSFLAPHPLPGQVMEGLVSRLRPPGRHGEQVRTQLWPAGLPEVFRAGLVLRPPSSEGRISHPACSCAVCLLSLRPQWAGRSSEDALSPALPSSWLLEGQAPAAWVLLELDLLQGEDGGSVLELVHTLPQGPEVGVVQGCLC